ncbi:DUF1249 domain-containing protein [Ferrimonas senticii]|uniref:DUF1249 domain-containing protein n=1 Tax=Ferrimonas senticii TaxID=394566 RepID=UPI00041E747B|nr:DUF1249 domain-containing protein [Ferrimonas senticii]
MNARRRYAPNLPKLMALYARNYRSLQWLLTQARRQQGEQRVFHWRHQSQPLQLKLTLTEQTKYTETVLLSREDRSLPSWPLPQIQLRIYHDAQVAEVLTGQQFSRFLPVYSYPNDAMVQRDEKFQVNLFATELLEQFQRHQWRLINHRAESHNP